MSVCTFDMATTLEENSKCFYDYIWNMQLYVHQLNFQSFSTILWFVNISLSYFSVSTSAHTCIFSFFNKIVLQLVLWVPKINKIKGANHRIFFTSSGAEQRRSQDKERRFETRPQNYKCMYAWPKGRHARTHIEPILTTWNKSIKLRVRYEVACGMWSTRLAWWGYILKL